MLGHISKMSRYAGVYRVVYHVTASDWTRPPSRSRQTWLTLIRDDFHRLDISQDGA